MTSPEDLSHIKFTQPEALVAAATSTELLERLFTRARIDASDRAQFICIMVNEGPEHLPGSQQEALREWSRSMRTQQDDSSHHLNVSRRYALKRLITGGAQVLIGAGVIDKWRAYKAEGSLLNNQFSEGPGGVGIVGVAALSWSQMLADISEKIIVAKTEEWVGLPQSYPKGAVSQR